MLLLDGGLDGRRQSGESRLTIREQNGAFRRGMRTTQQKLRCRPQLAVNAFQWPRVFHSSDPPAKRRPVNNNTRKKKNVNTRRIASS